MKQPSRHLKGHKPSSHDGCSVTAEVIQRTQTPCAHRAPRRLRQGGSSVPRAQAAPRDQGTPLLKKGAQSSEWSSMLDWGWWLSPERWCSGCLWELWQPGRACRNAQWFSERTFFLCRFPWQQLLLCPPHPRPAQRCGPPVGTPEHYPPETEWAEVSSHLGPRRGLTFTQLPLACHSAVLPKNCPLFA